jgi:hypothetical protein
MVHVKNSDAGKVFSFVRAKGGDAVFVAQNYSAEPRAVTLEEIPHPGRWTEKGGPAIELAKGKTLNLAPWSSRVFSRSY